MVHGTRILDKARDLYNRSNGRRNVSPQDVHFKEHIPLALNNRVKSSGRKDHSSPCAQYMLLMVNCLNKFDMNQTMCAKEISKFKECNEKHFVSTALEKSERSKRTIPVGENARFTSREMNEYFQRFPLSSRKGQRNLESDGYLAR